MLEVRQKKCFNRRLCPEEKPKEKIYRLKRGGKVRLRKPYSLRKRGGFIDLFRGRGREAIHSFYNGVTAEEIEKYVLGYEADLQRKKKGKKVVRPGKKTGGLMEAIEERNALLKQAALKNKENKETFFKRNYSGKWQ